MKKSIIISIKPEWLEKILNNEKTIEIRKSMPKCDLPIDVYIYCTKSDINLYKVIRENYVYFSGAVAEPFDTQISFSLTKEKLDRKYRDNIDNGFSDIFTNIINGKIVAKFTLNKVEKFKVDYLPLLQEMGYVNPYSLISFTGNLKTKCLEQNSCLLLEDVYQYAQNENVFAWHINNLKIFKPMELNKFYKGNYEQIIDHLQTVGCDSAYCPYLNDEGCDIMYCPSLKIKKAPQSWCYCYKEN